MQINHTVGCKELSDWSESWPLYVTFTLRRRITVLVPGHFAGAVFDLKMSSISRILRDIASEMEQRAETISSMSKNSHYPRLAW